MQEPTPNPTPSRSCTAGYDQAGAVAAFRAVLGQPTPTHAARPTAAPPCCAAARPTFRPLEATPRPNVPTPHTLSSADSGFTSASGLHTNRRVVVRQPLKRYAQFIRCKDGKSILVTAFAELMCSR